MNIKTSLTIPPNLDDGVYDMKLFTFDPKKPNRKIQLGIKGMDTEWRYDVLKMKIGDGLDGEKYIYVLPN